MSLKEPPRKRRQKVEITRGESGFECPCCTKTLTREQTRRDHIKKFHPEYLSDETACGKDKRKKKKLSENQQLNAQPVNYESFTELFFNPQDPIRNSSLTTNTNQVTQVKDICEDLHDITPTPGVQDVHTFTGKNDLQDPHGKTTLLEQSIKDNIFPHYSG